MKRYSDETNPTGLRGNSPAALNQRNMNQTDTFQYEYHIKSRLSQRTLGRVLYFGEETLEVRRIFSWSRMAESDEEYDRRRGRDKFRRERNDYDRREERRGGREPWEDRGGREPWAGRRDRRDSYREYDRRRDRYSPARHDISPPQMKRMRRDWDDNYPHYDMPMPMPAGPPMHGSWGGPGPGDMHHPQQHPYGNPMAQRGPAADMIDFPTQPPLMTFKQFLASQDDNISDEDAIRKFNEYKVDFRRQQISDFFMLHKEEEWFRSKYHPEECVQRREEARAALKRRNNVFSKIVELGYLDGVSLDIDHSDVLVKLLDAAVILMEGGDEEDLKILDHVEEKQSSQQQDGGSRSRTNSESQQKGETPTEKSTETVKTPIRITFDKKERQKSESSQQDEEKEDQEEKIPEEPLQIAEDLEDGEKKDVDADPSSQKERKNSTENVANNVKEKNDKKRKRDKTDEYDYRSSSDSDSSSFSDSEPEPAPPGVEEAVRSIDPVILGGNPVSPPPGKAGELSKKESQNKGDDKDEDTKDQNGTAEAEDTRPRALHKTCSIFLRNLAPSITKQEVEAMCKKYPGFLRVALQDPQPERRFFRRGWVTFDRTVNIREICWTLTNIRLRDCEMGAIVNRELKQRVRPVNGIVAHRPVAKADIKHAAKIIQNLDHKWNIWDESDEKQDKEKQMSFGMVSKNPVLKNVTDFLVDEGSAEEEALMGESMDDKPKEANPEVTLEKDEELLKVLDKMIMYLRIVHSFDYYSAVEYPNEDEMPHRCGIVHARTQIAPSRITQNDVNEWIQKFESKTVSFTDLKLQLEEEEAVKLGKKNTDA
ncbi:Serrate RNA effector molecule-like protein, partial [Lamellibrachia satsuma]